MLRHLPGEILPLRVWLIVLALICFLPITGLVSLREYYDHQTDQRHTYDGLVESAHIISSALAEAIRQNRAALETLAQSDALQNSNFDAFEEPAFAFLRLRPVGTILAVRASDGTIQHNYRLPKASTVGGLETNKPEQMTAHDGLSVSVPVLRDRQEVFDLMIVLPPATIQAIVHRQPSPASAVIIIADAVGTIVMRGLNEDGRGLPPGRANWHVIGSVAEGFSSTAATDDTHAVAAYAHVWPFGWIVIVGEPTETVHEHWLGLAGWLIASAGGVLVTAIVFAALATRRIMPPINRLGQLAESDEWIDVPDPVTTGLAELDQVAVVLVQAAAQRRQSGAELAEREAYYRALFEQSKAAMALIDLETMTILDCNEAAAKVVGGAVDQVKGSPIFDFVKIGISDTLKILKAATTGDGVRYETQIKGRAGSRDMVVAEGSVRIGDRTLLLLGGVDITDLGRTKIGWPAYVERLELACEAANVGIWDWDVESNAWSWSNYQWVLYGQSPDSGLSAEEAWTNAVDPAEAHDLEAGVAKALKTPDQPYIDEFNIRLPDGAMRRLLSRGKAVHGVDGRPQRIIGINMDVTARYEAEKARDQLLHMVDAERSRLSEIIEALPLGVGIVEAGGNVVIGNGRLKALMSRIAAQRQSIGDRGPSYLEGIGDLEGAEVNTRQSGGTSPHDPIERALNHGETGLPGRDYLVRDLDGQERWFRVGALPFQRKEGEPREALVLFLDVDAEKRLLEIQQQITAKLEQRVQEEVAAREAAQHRAAHADRIHALGQIAGGIAHDFNNILQAVSGSAALIERRPGDPERALRNARMVLDATKRGAAITGRLLAFARRGNLHAGRIDTIALLQDMADVLTHTLGGSVICRVDAPRKLPDLFADRAQLETVLVNLATNARDAMPNGGTLILAGAVETVSTNTRHPEELEAGRYVRITVTDTGTGMEQAVLSRVVEPFFTTKDIGKGTGLGLAMAKGFADQSGGGLSIESVVGHGTRVTLWLPTVDATRGGRMIEPEPKAIGENIAVLLVDDDPIVLETLTMSLEDADCTVFATDSGEDALARLDAGDVPDIVVSDLSMPGMDGITLIRTVQARWPGMPAVLLTSYAGDGATLAITEAIDGPFTLLRKPASGPQLVDCINALLESRGPLQNVRLSY